MISMNNKNTIHMETKKPMFPLNHEIHEEHEFFTFVLFVLFVYFVVN